MIGGGGMQLVSDGCWDTAMELLLPLDLEPLLKTWSQFESRARVIAAESESRARVIAVARLPGSRARVMATARPPNRAERASWSLRRLQRRTPTFEGAYARAASATQPAKGA
ncbi:hypothetical protein JKP88DRAFT_277022 [Tribonema minus]|uniref:Uncharacterized protein n=1 Tax=Tribonema minus TaxID=303371 RepID=A0A836CFK2_9STRA|nr:hypothetical protein JKP88DRAFT_277022 [Tribonema minus]